MLGQKNKRKAISLVAALSMLFTTLGGINASAEVLSVANQSFYENFEGYNDVHFNNNNIADKDFNGGWKIRNAVGAAGNIAAVDLSTVDTTSSGKAFKMGIDVTNVAGPSLYKDSGITIGKEDIIISGDVYIPEINEEDAKQYVRFYVSRGQSTTDVAASGGWTAYNPAVSPAFGLFFYNRNDLSPANVWKVCIAAPRQDSAGFEYNSTATSNFTVNPNTWYNLCYVYHPVSGTVDYYIDGKFLDSHPVGTTWTGDKGTFSYIIPNLATGKPLGNINIMAGGYESAETAAMFDNISVVKKTAADDAKFAEVEKGTDYIFANWDIPVDKAASSNITVKKMADDDITFSALGATDVSHTVTYKGSNGVGIKLANPLTTSLERYQVRVAGAKNVYGETVDCVYNFVVKNSPIVKGTAFTDDFTSDITGWGSDDSTNLSVSHNSTDGVLVADTTGTTYYKSITSPAINMPIDNSTEYIDLDFDLKGVADNTNYEAYIRLIAEGGGQPVGILLNEVYIKPLTKAGARIDTPNAPNTIGDWQSYRLRYYPWKGKIQVFAGDSQQTLSKDPVLTTDTYENHNGGNPREGTGHFIWNADTNGDAITGFTIKLGHPSVTYLDNVKATSYGYPVNSVVRGSFTETFDSGVNGWYANLDECLTVAHKSGEYNGKSNMVMATAIGDAYGQLLSPTSDAAYFNLPVNENIEYVDVAFDLRAEVIDTQTEFEAYIMLLEEGTGTALNARHTGIFINQAQIKTASRNGRRLDNSVASNADMLGAWKSYKLRYYPNSGKIEVYVGNTQETLSDTPTYTETTYMTRNETTKMGDTKLTWDAATHGNKITGLSIQLSKNNTVVYLDNISAASYSKPVKVTTVKAAAFENANGKALDNKAGAKKLNIYLDNAEIAPDVKINGSPVAGTLNEISGIYEIELGTMLVGNTDYTLNINGTDYTFATGGGEFKVSDLRFEKSNGAAVTTLTNDVVITPKVDVFNSTENAETPYLIWVAYNGSEVKYIDLTSISAFAGYSDTVLGEALTVTSDYTMVKAFLWDGLSTLVKLTEDCVLERPAAN